MQLKDYKMVILMRKDLNLPAGKAVAQGGHAAVRCAFKSLTRHPFWFLMWWLHGEKKIVLAVNDKPFLFAYDMLARKEGFVVSLIQDAGHTCVEPGTETCLGIGPAPSEKIDKLTGKLKLYK